MMIPRHESQRAYIHEGQATGHSQRTIDVQIHVDIRETDTIRIHGWK